MEEVRVNERAPTAGVAYCTPTRLGRSRVEYFLSISLCIMLGVGSHALYARVRHSFICFTSKRLLLLDEWWDISGVSESFRAWVYTHLAAKRNVFLLCYTNCGPATGFRRRIFLIIYFFGNYRGHSHGFWTYNLICGHEKNYVHYNEKAATQSAVIVTIQVNFGADAFPSSEMRGYPS